MNWKKIGRIYCPSIDSVYTHAMFPEVEILSSNENLLRIYYTARDSNNVGFPTYLEGHLNGEEFATNYVHGTSIIDKPDIGNFDDSGVNITSLIKINGESIFYYYGWNLGVTVPFRNAIGVSKNTSDDKPQLKRVFPGAIIDRDRNNPGLCATPCVIEDAGIYRMYFTQGSPWILRDGKAHVACTISYAESYNGFDWQRSNMISVDNLPSDHVVTTPFVIKEEGLYKMWYSFRGEKYRIGYAESIDGIKFVRKDDAAGITVSSEGWDSEMVCYPKVFNLNNKTYMIYCGNEYGKTGFGLAIKM
jgi:hypothetical protein